MWSSIHVHGGLQLGRLQSRAKDSGSSQAFTFMAEYSLGAYNLRPRIRNLVKHSVAWGLAASGPTISGHGLGIWHSMGAYSLGGLHSLTTDFESCKTITYL